MKKLILVCAGMLACSAAQAENLQGVNKMICGSGQARICLETGDCYTVVPWELNIPDFVVIDLKRRTVSTTRSSGLDRSTEFATVERTDGLIQLQGFEGRRAFSFVINEPTGRMTASISLDGMSIAVFGGCTDADL